MRVLIEIVVLVNAIGGTCGWAARRWVKRRRESNLQHVRELERENAEMDSALSHLREGTHA